MKTVHQVTLCNLPPGWGCRAREKCGGLQPLAAGVLPEAVCVDVDPCSSQVRAIITIETEEDYCV
jgi:hypothetical protein